MKFKKTDRSQRESISDKLLLLYTLDKFRFTGKTKLHKAVFFAEKSTNEKKLKIFNFDFVRYDFGEYSNELQCDYRELVNSGLVFDTKPIEVSQEGKELLKRFNNIFNRNKLLINQIEPIIEHIVSLPLDRVKEIAYTKVIINGIAVGKMKSMEPVLNKLNEDVAEIKFDIENKYIENLAFIFNSGFVIVDEETKQEYDEIQKIMRPKIKNLLMKLDAYEEAC